jgi:hypothetical protein
MRGENPERDGVFSPHILQKFIPGKKNSGRRSLYGK